MTTRPWNPRETAISSDLRDDAEDWESQCQKLNGEHDVCDMCLTAGVERRAADALDDLVEMAGKLEQAVGEHLQHLELEGHKRIAFVAAELRDLLTGNQVRAEEEVSA